LSFFRRSISAVEAAEGGRVFRYGLSTFSERALVVKLLAGHHVDSVPFHDTEDKDSPVSAFSTALTMLSRLERARRTLSYEPNFATQPPQIRDSILRSSALRGSARWPPPVRVPPVRAPAHGPPHLGLPHRAPALTAPALRAYAYRAHALWAPGRRAPALKAPALRAHARWAPAHRDRRGPSAPPAIAGGRTDTDREAALVARRCDR
jgi:hypothetical protein